MDHSFRKNAFASIVRKSLKRVFIVAASKFNKTKRFAAYVLLACLPVLAYSAPSDDYLAEVLEDSASTGGANNANGTAVTATQLTGITGVTGVIAANEPGYRNAIALETGFSNPPVVSQVQSIINAVNADGNVCNIVTDIPYAECDSLVNLYNSAGGNAWTNKNNWLTGTAAEDWHGIAVTNGHVASIGLVNNNLIGTIPDLNALTELTNFTAYTNSLTGTLGGLSQLTNMTYLHVGGNQLTGNLEPLANLINLTQLHVNSNQLSGDLTNSAGSLSGLTSLHTMQVASNFFTGTLDPLAPLTGLRSLHVGTNQFSGNLSALSSLVDLVTLFVFSNQLSGDFSHISNMVDLTDFRGYTNQFTGTLNGLSGLSSLAYLHVGGNQLTGNLDPLGNLSNLTHAYVNSNNLSGDIASSAAALSGMTSINVLYFSSNDFTGSLDALSSLTSMKNLYASNNQLTGNLSGLSPLTNLTVIHVLNNQLTGDLSHLSTLSDLANFQAYTNQLSGTLAGLSGLTELAYLYVSGNQLTGNVEPLGNLSKLTHAYVHANLLSGDLASSANALAGLTSLKLLHLSSNQFTGNLDPLASITSLESLYITGNQLVGDLSGLSPLTNLTLIHVFNNQLSGDLSHLSTLSNLVQFQGYTNQFTGTLAGLSELSELSYLFISGNQLTGNLEPLGNLSKLTHAYVHANQLSGDLASSANALSGMTALKLLYISTNQFTGNLDPLASLTNLESLYANGNSISGDFSGLSGLTKLNLIHIYTNQLTGDLSHLSNLVNLTQIQAYTNQLSGPLDGLSALTELTLINLGGNQITGSLAPLANLSKLVNLYIGVNLLSGDISYLENTPSLIRTQIQGNNFTFTDLEPSLTAAAANLTSQFLYVGQNLVDTERNLIAGGDTISLSAQIPVNPSGNDSYQWYKNGVLIPGASARQYDISNTTEADDGTYTYVVDNTSITEFDLTSRNITVQVDSDNDGQPNATDTDDDNDGSPDVDEALFGTDPLDPSSNPHQQALAEILEDSASSNGTNNSNDTAVSSAQLTQINGLINLNAGSESAYQAAFAQETGFSNPVTVEEVQTVIDAVNAPNHFVITVNAAIADASIVGRYRIPSNGTNYQIQWEEVGNESGNNSGGYVPVDTAYDTIDFGAPGTYRIMFDPIGASTGTNDFDHFSVGDGGDKNKLVGVSQWGTTQWSSMANAFYGAVNLADFTASDIPNFTSVTNMESMFAKAALANPATSGWDTSSVTTTFQMFWDAVAADPDVSGWNTSSIVNMRSMFYGASSANPEVSSWDTSSVTNMWGTFSNTSHMNPDVSNWDTSSVTVMDFMFGSDSNPVANPDVSGWDTSSVTSMWGVFWGASSANPDVSNWNTSSVVNMSSLFEGAANANPDITGWDTSSTTQMAKMFSGATAFDRDISGFDYSNVTDISEFFKDAGLSQPNYDAFLISLDSQTLQPGLDLDGGNSIYCQSEIARSNLIANDGWTISDGGRDCNVLSIAEVLEDSASSGGAGNGNGTAITVVQLSDIDGLININNASEAAYQSAIATESGFSNPPSVVEIQSVLDSVNALNHFVIVVDASIADATPAGQYQIPSPNTNYQIQWEEVGNEGINHSGGYVAVSESNHTVDFGAAGTYRVMIDPIGASTGLNDFNQFSVADSGDKNKLVGVSQWGTTTWATMVDAFQGAVLLADFSATDIPDLSSVTDMKNMFAATELANPSTTGWDTSSVTSMYQMFWGADAADPDVSSWNTSQVTSMYRMFSGTTVANPDVSAWDTSSVTDMRSVFSVAAAANPDVSSWDTSSVTTMVNMFYNADAATPDVSNWDTSQVTSMHGMFGFSSSVNPDVSAWDTSSVTDMEEMFAWAGSANPDVSNWDTSSVTNMPKMFVGAVSFDRDISGFNISNVTDISRFLDSAGISQVNYDAFLISLDGQTLQSGLDFDGGDSIYCQSETARASLIANDGWTITDGGRDCNAISLAEVLEDSGSTGGASNNNGTSITVAQLSDISGLININTSSEVGYQTAIAAEQEFSNPPTVNEIQSLIDSVNAPNHFVIVVDASSNDSTPAGSYQIPSLSTNYQIQWEEVGNESSNNSRGYMQVTTPNHVIDFGLAGTYRIMIDPIGVANGVNDFSKFSVNDSGDKLKLIGVSQWGTTVWSSMHKAFYGAARLADFTAVDIPDFSQVTDMFAMMDNAVLANPNTSNWDTSNVTTMAYMFRQASNANPDTSNWDTSSVTTTARMFSEAVQANPNVSSWNTVSLTEAFNMFRDATAANPDVSNWDTTTLTDIRNMFRGATSALPDVSGWDTSSISNMKGVFHDASMANPDVGAWDTSSATDMSNMFMGASSFDRDISGFNFSNVMVISDFISDTDLSQNHYDALLESLDSQNLQAGLVLGGGDNTYCLGEFAREHIIEDDGWTIVDGGKECTTVNLAEVLEDSTSLGGSSNVDGIAVTADQLREINGIDRVEMVNEQAYQLAIAAEENFSNPPTLEEVQAIIDSVNASVAALTEVLEDSPSSGGAENDNAISVTMAQLAAISGISDLDAANEALYQTAIQSESEFSNLPTHGEVQAVINAVNASVLALSEVLEDSNSTGGANNSNTVAVTAEELSAVTDLIGVEAANESVYQTAISAELNFSNPVEVAELQALITSVNSDVNLAEVLEDSSSVGGSNNSNETPITAERLANIVGITGVDMFSEALYQDAIAAETDFSNPPTVAEVQAVIDAVNQNDQALTEVLEDSSSPGGANNANGSAVTIGQLLSITGVTGVIQENETEYQSAIAAYSEFSNLPTLSQVQEVIDEVNSELVLASVFIQSESASINSTGLDSSNLPPISTAQLVLIDGLEFVLPQFEPLYQEAIAEEAGFSSPPTVQEVQNLINRVNEEATSNEAALAEVLEESNSTGGGNNGNGIAISVVQLRAITDITNVLTANESAYQLAIGAETGFSQPPTLEEIQAIVNTVNESEAARERVLSASSSIGGGSGGNNAPVSLAQLQLITGLVRLEPANESVYQAAIQSETGFSQPPTTEQIQALVDAVNESESVLNAVLTQSSTAGGSGNGNIGIAQLNSIIGLNGVNPANAAAYQSAIAAETGFSNPPTLAELQALIDLNNDADGDGISDALELGRDSDGDGVPDAQDMDSDNDTISDLVESADDSDNDGVPNFRDLDSDNDGIHDIVERIISRDEANSFDLNEDGRVDAGQALGANGLLNEIETNAESGQSSIAMVDSDTDGVPDFLDLDSDNDGVMDTTEAGFVDANIDGEIDGISLGGLGSGLFSDDAQVDENGVSVRAGGLPRDTDTDGIEDFRDLDSDNDGLMDIDESFETSLDSDGDGRIDDFVDSNGNGVSENLERNPIAVLDTDQDGLYNLIDTDSDADGLSDLLESGGVDMDMDGQIDALQDENGDGVDDVVAQLPVVVMDTDSDGIPDYQDFDSDNDGVSDLEESGGIDADGDNQADGLTLSAALPDADGDGVPNHLQSENGYYVIVGGAGGCSIIGRGSVSGTDPIMPTLLALSMAWLLFRRRKTVL